MGERNSLVFIGSFSFFFFGGASDIPITWDWNVIYGFLVVESTP